MPVYATPDGIGMMGDVNLPVPKWKCKKEQSVGAECDIVFERFRTKPNTKINDECCRVISNRDMWK